MHQYWALCEASGHPSATLALLPLIAQLLRASVMVPCHQPEAIPARAQGWHPATACLCTLDCNASHHPRTHPSLIAQVPEPAGLIVQACLLQGCFDLIAERHLAVA